MRLSFVITILAGLLVLSACSDPSTNKSKAVTGEAAPVMSPQAAARGQKYVITPPRKLRGAITDRLAISLARSISTARLNRAV